MGMTVKCLPQCAPPAPCLLPADYWIALEPASYPNIPAPTLTTLAPPTIDNMAGPTLLTITGTNFSPNSQILIAGVGVQTTYLDDTHLRAVVDPKASGWPTGTVNVAVQDGPRLSNVMPLNLTTVAPPPA